MSEHHVHTPRQTGPRGTRGSSAATTSGADTSPAAGAIATVLPLRGPHPSPAGQLPTAEPSDLAGLSGLSVVELVQLYGRQADELTATVEAALAEEQTYYAQAAAVLAGLHRRRTARLSLLARALGEQHGGLDEAAHLAHHTPAHPTATATGAATATAADSPAPTTVFGYRAGDRVRDPRSGCTGRVHIHPLTPTQRAQGHPVAEVVWDGWETAVDGVVDLELAVAHGLAHLHDPQTRTTHDGHDGQVLR